ncbi:MAG: type I methionyl aminopeptidase [Ruminococcaceae bacterium]|nr:type I methionyl aminopeptidase [Oscillospiraceae bacterium]
MIQLKNSHQISLMKDAGRITGEALALGGELVKPGVTTAYIDAQIRKYIEKCGATPSFLGYGGFPASACISVNDQVIHGIPSEKVILCEGDIVKIDVGAYYKGFHGDSANTFRCGKVSDIADKLIEATKDSFMKALEQVESGKRIGDVGSAVERRVLEDGFSVVREFIGHGVGKELHESPEVPNYGTPGRGPRLVPGMVIAIEPMVCVGKGDVFVKKDGWTVVTADGSLSAHYEHTVALTDNGAVLLTAID